VASNASNNGVCLFWTRTNGAIWEKCFDGNTEKWNASVPLYGPGSALGGHPVVVGQSLAAISTFTNEISVFWVAQDASIQTGVFDPNPWAWQPPFLIATAANGVTSLNTQVSAVSSSFNASSVFWEGAGGIGMTTYYDPNGLKWPAPGEMALPGSILR
jgi:hypothetical protein